DIGGIAHQQVTFLQGRSGPARQIYSPAGAQSNHRYFHGIFLPATATVTPFFACLRTRSIPPARTAARSHTLSTPVISRTEADSVKSPSAFASSSAENTVSV